LQRFYVKTFGCRASQADGAALEAGLSAKGMVSTGEFDEADLVVLNTCTVTSTADDELRQTVRRIHRNRPEARILVTGCYAQRAPEEIAVLPGVSLVVGNSHKTRIPDLLDDLPDDTTAAPYHSFDGPSAGLTQIAGPGRVVIGDIFAQHEFLAAPVEDALGDRTRPNLKIQDGCNNRCSFCIIPSVRGRSRSSPPEQVIAEVRKLAAKYREVVLSGINLGRWGRELAGDGHLRLADLVRRLLDETPIERLRLSSVEPMDWSDDLLDLMSGSERIARHVHAPLQSGSDGVLRRMHRKYRPRHYADRILKARAGMPDCAVGADVMTGFPGETEAEFQESLDFIDALPFTYLHVFTYSERPGTPAADAPGAVPKEIRKRRTHLLRELSQRKNLEFRRSMVGRTLSVTTIEDGRTALSGNYLKVTLAHPRNPNRLEDVKTAGLTPEGLFEFGCLTVI
jgi:threonylcarbamoyladenosine tRNA methylthiotransferase MtaB